MDLDFFAAAGPFTELTDDQLDRVRSLGRDPRSLCRAAQGLVVSPGDATGARLSEQRLSDRNTRPSRTLLARVLELDAAALDQPRPANRRVVGTCRHFAVMATAFLRAVDLPARARCGFATYFIPPKKVDHWVVEFWSEADERWIRVDAEYIDRATPGAAQTEDLRPGEFLTSGEAWKLVRSGREDPEAFGVFGTENWGSGEIRGNAMRDLASLVRKVEMLPWDVWGPMEDSYHGNTGDTFDLLIDELAAACEAQDEHRMQRVYEQLEVPASLIG